MKVLLCGFVALHLLLFACSNTSFFVRLSTINNNNDNNNKRREEYTKAGHTTTSSPSPRNYYHLDHYTTHTLSHLTFEGLKNYMKHIMDGMYQ